MGSQHNKQEIYKMNGTNINDFYLHQVVGEGGFGRVMSSIYLKDKKKNWYAVKEINKYNLLQHKLGFEMITGELDALRRLGSGHPFITTLHFAFHDVDNCYFVFDLVTAHDLRHYLKRRVAFPEKTVAFYVSCLSSALAYIHRHGILHRDIKPENIILDKEGFPHIADFGVSYVEPHYEEQAYPMCRLASGTKQYLSPEVFTSTHAHGPEADYWSLGVTAYELLYGRRPFKTHAPQAFIKYLKDMYNCDARSPKRKPVVKTLSGDRVCSLSNEGTTGSTCVSSNPSSPSRSTGSSHSGSHKSAPSVPHLALAQLNLSCMDGISGELLGLALCSREQAPSEWVKLPHLSRGENPESQGYREHSYYYEDLWFVEADTPLQCKLAIPTAEHEFKLGRSEPELSTACKSVLRGLMEVRPSHRLGYNTQERLCRHKWFVEMQCTPPDLIAEAMPTMRPALHMAAQLDSDGDDFDGGLGDGNFQTERVSAREQERFVGFEYTAAEHCCYEEPKATPADEGTASAVVALPALPSVASVAKSLAGKVFGRGGDAEPASSSPSGVAELARGKRGDRASFFQKSRRKVSNFPLLSGTRLI